ncbi:MAG TPA: aminotransferase class I/II-fold pyridoxal phosphate-dependent enzyme [Stackebrandtia sp.]|jgi:cystathionine beta-lyase|uniref:MalY/PatB family protein n=1 Tax=Stackebrandtia sp. TaxID=2023065 RepID=UPI002D40F048|nr:aminotransferase class I/II-fold pyridoxal phosphate-dependent enzyme [Stackebrandtia sp.]HZE37912.1 aminotransferase class I/II-fold pyridoxal phosphate-dependent enzyme [Stackebrandtia sp.]
MSSPLEELTLDELRRRRSVKWRAYDPDVLPLWVAEMDTPLAPPIRDALATAVALGDTGYANSDGLPSAFAGFAKRRWNWDVDPASVLLCPDVAAGALAALGAIVQPGETVVINTPVYPPFFAWIRQHGLKVAPSPLRRTVFGYELDLDRLESDFAAGPAAYLLCNPHNPCGVVYEREDLLAIAELAHRYDVRVIADEIHAPLTAPGVPHVPFASLDTEASARGFTMVAASKAWNLAGLKAAMLLPGPEADVPRLEEDYAENAGLFGVIASQAAYDHGEEWLDALRRGIADNARLLGDLLFEELTDVGYHEPRGTYLTWLDFTAYDLGDDPAEFLAETGRVALTPGTMFGEEGKGHARLNLATSPEILTEAVYRMAAAVNDRAAG